MLQDPNQKVPISSKESRINAQKQKFARLTLIQKARVSGEQYLIECVIGGPTAVNVSEKERIEVQTLFK